MDMFEQTIALMEQQRKQGIYPGYVTSFIDANHRQRIVRGKAALVPKEEPMTIDAVFDLASLTKIIATTSIVLRLVDRKRIQLTDCVQQHLPAYQDSRVTIRHLLTHTSDSQTWIVNRDQLTPTALRQAYLHQISGPKLGEVVKYTDTGFILLGFMLEELLQKPLATIFEEEVCRPLGLTHTSLGNQQVTMSSLIVPTEKQLDGQVLRGLIHDPKARILDCHAGNAGVFSTLQDLERFVKMYLANDGTYLSPALMQQVATNQTGQLRPKRGLGWELRTVAEQSILFHTGYTGTFLWIDVVEQTAWIFLSNRVHPEDHRQTYLKQRDQLIAQYIKERYRN